MGIISQSYYSLKKKSIFYLISGCYDFETMVWCMLAYIYHAFIYIVFTLHTFYFPDQYSHCNSTFSSLTFSLASTTGMSNVHTIWGKRIMDHTQSHASITKCVNCCTCTYFFPKKTAFIFTLIEPVLFLPKKDCIHFHFNRASVIRPVKHNQLSFPSIEINKPHLAWVQCLVDQIQVQRPIQAVAWSHLELRVVSSA